MKRKIIGIVFIILGLLLLVISILIAYNNYRIQKTAGEYSDEIVTQFRQMYNFPEIDAKITTTVTEETDLSHNPEETEQEAVPEEKTCLVNGNSYLGILQIPSLDVELPVSTDFSYDKMKKTPCRYSGTVADQNLVICAHNYSSHFGGINKLVNGDIIQFIGFDENIHTYSVVSIEQIEPTDIDAVGDGDYALVLFTCNLSGNARIIVKCDQI